MDQHPIAGSQDESTHKLWKNEVGVSTQSQLKGREHTQAEEGQSGRWGQHPVAGSKDENTHELWKDEVGGGVSV